MKPKMNNEELRALNQRRKIFQIAWVTRDLEKSMKAWVENLKIGPRTVLTFTDQSLTYLKVDKGIGVTQTGKFEADFHYYLDTEPKLNFIYELGNCPKLELTPDKFWTYPPEGT